MQTLVIVKMKTQSTLLGILISLTSLAQESEKTEIFPFRSRANGKIGYMNENNEIIVQPQYSSGTYFGKDTYFGNEKYAAVSIENDSIEWFAVIDLKGNYFISFEEGYEFIGLKNTYESWILVFKDGKYGYINKKKEVLIPLEYDNLGDFYGGLAVAEKDSQYGFIDSTNCIIIDFQYDWASGFGNIQPDGLRYAMVEKAEKTGCINNKGILVVSFLYDFAYPFHRGIAVVKKDEKYGCVNTKGEILIPFDFEIINDSDDIIKARKEFTSKKEFYFDRQGTFIGTGKIKSE